MIDVFLKLHYFLLTSQKKTNFFDFLNEYMYFNNVAKLVLINKSMYNWDMLLILRISYRTLSSYIVSYINHLMDIQLDDVRH